MREITQDLTEEILVIIRRQKCDCFIAIFINAELIEKNPIAFDMAIALVLQFSPKWMIPVLRGKKSASCQELHDDV